MGAASQNGDVPIKRIRDLLALTKSPNPHEATLARKRADELMRRYKVTEADLIEEAVVPADLPPSVEGNQRQELGRLVANSRRVVLRISRRDGTIAFRGYPEAAKDARDLFVVLVGIVERNCECLSAGEAERLLYRTCFWLGYVEAIQKQLDPERGQIPEEALQSILKAARTQPPPFVENAVRAFKNMADRLGTSTAERFKQSAHDNGLSFGARVPVPPYRPSSPPRSPYARDLDL